MKIDKDHVQQIRDRVNGEDYDTDDLLRWFETLLEAVEERDAMIEKAIIIAIRYAGIDGAHHKAWAIDQIVRALTACPQVEKTATDCRGNPYTYEAQGESEDYKMLVKECGEWDVGISP